MMQVRHLQLSHGTRILCPDVTFHVDAGELILLAGPNGSGKTTLLRQLAAPEGASEICSHPRLHKREGPAGFAGGRGREATFPKGTAVPVKE